MSAGKVGLVFGTAAGIVAVAAIVGAAIATFGLYNVGADSAHGALTARFLVYVREHSIAARAANIPVPPLNSPDMVAEGASHYDEMCTICHLGPGIAENELRPGLNPKPPRLAQARPGDPRIEFWTVKHGIKMTGMPAWGTTHSDGEIWAIVAFLQQLPHLSTAQYRALVAKGNAHHHHETGETHNGMKM